MQALMSHSLDSPACCLTCLASWAPAHQAALQRRMLLWGRRRLLQRLLLPLLSQVQGQVLLQPQQLLPRHATCGPGRPVFLMPLKA